MCAYPVCERRLVDFACREREYGQCCISLCCCKTVAIQRKKQAGCKKSGAFVAINKSVIFGQPESICGSQIGKVRRAIGNEILRSRQCGIKQTRITQTRCATVFSQTFGVQ